MLQTRVPIVTLIAAMLGSIPLPSVSCADEFFETRIRPMLVKHCYQCHSGDAARRGDLQGDLQLDTRNGLRVGGDSGPAIQPNSPDESELIRRLRSDDASEVMPPDGSLPQSIIDDFAQWIRRGAIDPRDGDPVDMIQIRLESGRKHWAYRPLQPEEVPELQLPSEAWNSPIDRYILRKLGDNHLRPSPQADRYTLIRRLSIDLTGLPPTREQIERFVADRSSEAWPKLVDKFLTSSHYGERWGRHWLDVARFGESDGNSDDNDIINKDAWKYRDAVIHALNQNMPWDQFVRMQLAGSSDSASAETKHLEMFIHVGTRLNDNSNPNDRKFHILNDMVSTTGQAFLATTTGCARCHDHKVDPVTSEEYYQLTAVFFDAAKVIPDAGGKHVPLKLNQAHLLSGGDWNSPVHPVSAGGLKVLMSPDSDGHWFSSDRDGRDALVDWMTDVDHGAGSLLARVIVNRLWHHHFGRGLVDTTNDFGGLGSQPSHPELLDYLASQLIAHQWKLKPIHRMILLSATWRQGAAKESQQARIDADNRFLWQRTPRRMEAEIIRDSLLAVAGSLSTTAYGPSIPVGSRKKPFKDTPDTWRRSVYLMSPRMDQHPVLEIFDLPDNEFSTGVRDVSTTPAGALFILNSPFVKDQAARLAARVKKEVNSESINDLVIHAYLLALARRPSDAEIDLAISFLGDSDVSLESLAAYCHTLMTLNEFIYVN